MLLLASAFGMLYVRLLHGPVSLTWLAATLERSISEELDGRPVRIDGAVMRLDAERGLIFGLTNSSSQISTARPWLWHRRRGCASVCRR